MISEFKGSLQYFIDHPGWFREHALEPECKQLCDRLFRPQKGIELNPMIAKVRQIINETCPHLFVHLKINDIEFTVVTSILERQSTFFKTAISFNQATKEKSGLELQCPDLSTESIGVLGEGLQSETFVINPENAYELYQFADMYSLDRLKCDVITFFKSSKQAVISDRDAFQNLLSFSLKYQIPSLLQFCHDALFSHPDLERAMQAQTDMKMFVQTVSQNIRLKQEKSNGLEGRLFIEVNRPSLTNDQIESIKYLYTVLPSPGISITGKWGEQDLKKFAQAFPDLKSLRVNKLHVENLPEIWEASLLELFCIDCHQLKRLSLTRASIVELNKLSSLESLHVPLAVDVRVIQANQLKELVLPKAERVHCTYNIQLLSLQAPAANVLKCVQCHPSIQIEAPSPLVDLIKPSDMAKLPNGVL
jgi:hypothetical protein